MKKSLILLIAPLLISFSSCQIIIDEIVENSLENAGEQLNTNSWITVNVINSSTNFGIEGAEVSLHYSMDDAETNTAPISVVPQTNTAGQARFETLPNREEIFVRARFRNNQTCAAVFVVSGNNTVDMYPM